LTTLTRRFFSVHFSASPSLPKKDRSTADQCRNEGTVPKQQAVATQRGNPLARDNDAMQIQGIGGADDDVLGFLPLPTYVPQAGHCLGQGKLFPADPGQARPWQGVASVNRDLNQAATAGWNTFAAMLPVPVIIDCHMDRCYSSSHK